MAVFDPPRDTGPYGITTTPDGQVFFARLLAIISARSISTDGVTVLEPPMPRQARGAFEADSRGGL
jgi:virginiamycin B lyase